MMEKVIAITPEGVVSSLHQDEFSLSFLGEQKIRRATDITFNEKTQKWDIHYIVYEGGIPLDTVTSEPLCGFDWYDEARKFEVLWLNECTMRSVSPLYAAGMQIAGRLRSA